MKRVRGIWLPDGDTHFQRHLEQGDLFEGKGTYQYKKITLALGYLQKDQFGLAIDVGAHVGLWSRVLAHHFKEVVAFEPLPELAACLRKNVEDLENVQVQQCALGSNADFMKMGVVPIRENSGNTRIATQRESATPDTLTFVDIRALDSFAADVPVNFIKVDVEGYELDVLKGAEHTLLQDKPFIVVEQKRGNAERYGYKQHDALNYLISLGFEEVFEVSGDHGVRFKS